MDKRVLKFFKRNQEAKVCHLVLLDVFADMETAGKYARAKNAKGAIFTREDYEKWVASSAASNDELIINN